jgi:acyl-CoA oxidase
MSFVKVAEGDDKSRLQAENMHALQLHVVSRAHIEVFLLSESIKQLNLIPASTPVAIKTVLSKLVSLFVLITITSQFSPFSASFIGDGYLTTADPNEMRQQIDGLLE